MHAIRRSRRNRLLREAGEREWIVGKEEAKERSFVLTEPAEGSHKDRNKGSVEGVESGSKIPGHLHGEAATKEARLDRGL